MNKVPAHAGTADRPLGEINVNVGISNPSKVAPLPVFVPVAQFQAFKVHEDQNDQQANKENINKNVPFNDKKKDLLEQKKPTTKQSVKEQEVAKKDAATKEGPAVPAEKENERRDDSVPVHNSEVVPIIVYSSPMCVDLTTSKPVADQKPCYDNRDSFFEIGEYREDILNYLREHEVRV